jgi:hypothetical protein
MGCPAFPKVQLADIAYVGIRPDKNPTAYEQGAVEEDAEIFNTKTNEVIAPEPDDIDHEP